MTVALVLISLGLGCLGGILAGLLGVGGGIVLVPAMRFLAPHLGLAPDVAMHAAVATSVALIVPTAFVSARSHHRRGAVDTAILRLWSLPVALGGLAAGAVASAIPTEGLALLFGVVALGVGWHMARGGRIAPASTRLPSKPAQGVIALFIGTVSSWMGIGGGTLSVPILTAFGVPVHRAVGTASAIGLCISIPALIGWVYTGWGIDSGAAPHLGFIQLVPFGLIIGPMLLLAPVGARMAHALPAAKLRRFFGVFLILTALTLLWRSI